MTSPVYTFKKLNLLYNVHETFTAGVMLEGWEVKALLADGGDINMAHCAFSGNDFCILNAKISPEHNHLLDDTYTAKQSRARKLLLNKRELNKIREMLAVKGYTCVGTKLYRNANRLWKLDLALVTGKKLWDKREDIKKRDLDRAARRGD